MTTSTTVIQSQQMCAEIIAQCFHQNQYKENKPKRKAKHNKKQTGKGPSAQE